MSMTRQPLRKKLISRIFLVVGTLCVLSQSGCAPTYPRGMVDDAIIQLCREEYDVEVKVKILDNTVGVYIPIESLFDPTLNISKDAAKKINDVMLSTSRVTLSTDAELDFYIVIAQDPVLPEIEVVLIRYVKDIKMLHFDRISRGEFVKRMIVAVKITPQAQKEKVLRNIFSRLNIKEADELVDEYLETSKITSIGDIGYWNDTFYIKNIGMDEFLGLQISDRTKAKFAATPDLKEAFKLNLIKGEFLRDNGKAFYRFSYNVTPLGKVPPPPDVDVNEMMSDMMLEISSEVFHGYKFYDFWNIEIVNTKDNKVLFATSDELKDFRKKKIKKEELKQWYR